MVKIVQITSLHNESSTRIFYKECISLADYGYKVIYIVPTDKDKFKNNIYIRAVEKPKNRIERFLFTSMKIFKMALQEKSQLYHFHDPDLIIIGILLRLLGKKVIYDVHETVPEQILNKNWIGNLYIRKIVALLANILEKVSANLFDGIVGATDDIAQRFPKYKTTTLKNLPILKIIDSVSAFKRDKAIPIIIYAGGLTRIRGIKEIIQSMEYVNEKAELWLLGNWQSKQYREECEKLQGWNKTKYLGFKPLEKVYSLMKSADIGITNFLPVNNHLKSNPNKIYEYMACSVPVIMSDFPYWKEVFGDFALFANPYDPESIAQQISILLKDKEKAQELGRKGREVVENQYNWETESKKLIKLYQRILGKDI